MIDSKYYNKNFHEIVNDGFNLFQNRLNQVSFNNRQAQSDFMRSFLNNDPSLLESSINNLLTQRSELIKNLLEDQKNFIDYMKLIKKEV